jgi:hypothetical protein
MLKKTSTRPLRPHLDRVHTIVSKHADSALAAAGHNVGVAARILIDSLAVDSEFTREVDAMNRINRGLMRQPRSTRRRKP